MFFVYWALYFAFYYVRAHFLRLPRTLTLLMPHLQVGIFARNVIGLSYTDSINLLLVMVGVGIPGRLIPNYAADRWTGPVNAVLPFVLLCGVMLFAWTGIKSPAALYVFAAFYGTGSAGIQSLFPAALASLTRDLKKSGTRLGMGFFVVSFATLSGPPLAGALIAKADGGFLYAQLWAGCSMCSGLGLLVAARIAETGWRIRERV